MPMIELKDRDGNTRWISVFPFNSLDSARSYVKNSAIILKIVKGGEFLYWVCSPEDAAWANACGYKTVKKDDK